MGMKFRVLDEAIWKLQKDLDNHYRRHVLGDAQDDTDADTDFKLIKEFETKDAYKTKSEEVSVLPAEPIDEETEIEPNKVYGFISKFHGTIVRVKLMLSPINPSLVYICFYKPTLNKDKTVTDAMVSFYSMSIPKLRRYISNCKVRDLRATE